MAKCCCCGIIIILGDFKSKILIASNGWIRVELNFKNEQLGMSLKHSKFSQTFYKKKSAQAHQLHFKIEVPSKL